MTYIVAFDFESFGPLPSVNGFAALGAVIGNLSSGEIIDSFCEYANQSDYHQDVNCIENFWLKHPDLYQRTLENCSNSTKHPQEVIDMFIKWINNFIRQGGGGQSVYLITDCSTYDSGILKSMSLTDTLKIIDPKNTRDIIDTTSYYLGISGLFMTEDIVDSDSFESARKRLKLTEFKSKTQHDHNPMNDAKVIFEKWCFIQNGLLGVVY
jgi:hypothetical protein